MVRSRLDDIHPDQHVFSQERDWFADVSCDPTDSTRCVDNHSRSVQLYVSIHGLTVAQVQFPTRRCQQSNVRPQSSERVAEGTPYHATCTSYPSAALLRHLLFLFLAVGRAEAIP